jgi:hypothetical protein
MAVVSVAAARVAEIIDEKGKPQEMIHGHTCRNERADAVL